MTSTESSCMGIALFGIGRAGSIHFGNLIRNPRAVVRYVIDENTAGARAVVEAHRLSDVITVLKPQEQDQALEDKKVDGVFVCTPTFTHEPIVKNALKHGKGVFCEKPVSQTIEGVVACYEEAERVGRPLLCAFNRRFDPSISGIHNRMLAGEVGKVHVVKTCSRDKPKATIAYLSTSGGIFHDCAIHDIDLVCWLLEEYPISVYTQAHAHDPDIANIPDVDTAIIVMKFPSGAMATIDVSRDAVYGYDQRIEVFGSGGMLLSNNQQPNGIMGHTALGVTSSCFKGSCIERYDESYAGVDQHFLDVLSGEAELIYTKAQVLNVSTVASACEKSYCTGQSVSLTWET